MNRHARQLAGLAGLLLLGGCHASSGCPLTANEVALWPGAPPGEGPGATKQVVERSVDPTKLDRTVSGVTKPLLRPYLASRPNGAAAIVIPGGGYRYITLDKEGVDIAQWLNTLGVSAFVLEYRLPSDFPGQPWLPLSDAQRALRTLAEHAASCQLDSARLGVVGFSAGGHIASQLATRFDAQLAPASDEVDAISAQPAFAVLLYPVISMDPAIAHAGSRTALLGPERASADVRLYSSELQVTRKTPPTFIALSKHDSSVKPENSLRFAEALKAAGVAHELHLYEGGGHGTGIRNASGDMADWPKQAASWLKASHFLD